MQIQGPAPVPVRKSDNSLNKLQKKGNKRTVLADNVVQAKTAARRQQRKQILKRADKADAACQYPNSFTREWQHLGAKTFMKQIKDQ